MPLLSRLSIKSKLLLMLLGVSLTSVLIIGILSLRTAQSALRDSIEGQLTSIRSLQADQIYTYFSGFASVTRTLGENASVANSAKNFIVAYREGAEQTLTAEQHQLLTDFYTDEYLPRLAANSTEDPLAVLLRPRTPAANYFQYHYIANNPSPYGEKSDLVTAQEDVTSYRRLHQAVHPRFLRIQEELGFGDIYLIDINTGDIIYSINKQPDFATNLFEGPYSTSGLGLLAARISAEPERGMLQTVDYRPYPPSLNAPTAFFGVPIFSDNEAIAILALQLPVEQIDNVMTSSGDWAAVGLGETGESYLVGDDLLMRSVSRAYLEDTEAYLDNALARGVRPDIVDAMSRYSTVLLQRADTEATRRALAGESGTVVADNYLGEETLSAYAPLTLGGQPWAIVSEVNTTEILRPLRELQRTMLVWTVGLMLAVAFLAILLAQAFVRPIDKLVAAAKRIATGEDDVRVEIDSDDEFGDLGENFNNMAESIHEQKTAIAEKNAENERLLLNILPAPIAERLQAGERVADLQQQVSVIFIHALGFAGLSEEWTAVESAGMLERLIDLLDEAAEKHGVERVKTVGETYIAACGHTTPRLDHASQTVAFALDALRIMQRFDQEQERPLTLQIGINSGPVVSGVVGTARFNYELWGETVEVAYRLHTRAKPNGLLITQSVYQRIDRQADFQRSGAIADLNVDLAVYEYAGSTAEQPTDAEEGEQA